MKIVDILNEQRLSGELNRVRELFVKGFKTFLKSKNKEVKLDFIENVIHDTLNKSEIKFLIIRLQKGKNKE